MKWEFVRILSGAIGVIILVFVSILGNQLSPEITYWIRQRSRKQRRTGGRPPKRSPGNVWFSFCFSLGIAVFAGAIAAISQPPYLVAFIFETQEQPKGAYTEEPVITNELVEDIPNCAIDISLNPPSSQALGENVQIEATAACTNGVSSIRLFINENSVKVVNKPSFEFSWSTVDYEVGSYSVDFEITDSLGNIFTKSISYHLTEPPPPYLPELPIPEGTPLPTNVTKLDTINITNIQEIAYWNHSHTRFQTVIAFNPSGRYLASGSGDGSIRLWEIATGTMLDEELEAHKSRVTSLAFLPPTGYYLASGSADYFVRVWRVSNESLTSRQDKDRIAASHIVRSIAYSPDGTRLAAAVEDGAVIVWWAGDLHFLNRLEEHSLWVTCVGMFLEELENGNRLWLVSGSADGYLNLWYSPVERTFPIVKRFGKFTGSGITTLSFSTSSDEIKVASGHSDGVVRIWVLTNESIEEYTHQINALGPISALAFSLDGNIIIAGTDNGWLHLWSFTEGEELREPLDIGVPVESIAFSPCGTWLAVSSKRGISIFGVME